MKNLGSTLNTFVVGLFFVGSVANAQTTTTGVTDISVLPMAGPNMSDVVIDSNLTLNNGTTTTLDLHVSCYGTNLRSVANPLSPSANVEARISYVSSDGSTKVYTVNFPGKLAMIQEGVAQADITSDTKVENSTGVTTSEVFKTRMMDSMIRVAMSSTKTVGLDVLASGADFGRLANATDKSSVFTAVMFKQVMPPGAAYSQYMGWNGPLTSSVRWYVAENGKNVAIYASFPGENHYCGGFYSPLMLKFNNSEVAPKMLGRSNFALTEATVKDSPRVSWPSFLKEEEAYFLVNDINGNKIADHGGELFGDSDGSVDGFVSLAKSDENKDGVIDEKDPVYSKLLLWKDANHNGKSEKSEMKTLQSMGVKSISLTYKKDLTYIGDAAKIMGPGEFSFVDKKGKSQSGTVWDVYMKMVPK
jgi:hypothetical protein